MIKRFNYVFLLALCLFFVSCEQDSGSQKAESNATATGIVGGHHLIYTKHARCRMHCRHIDETEVEEIVNANQINSYKSDLESEPCPKVAYEGMSHDHQSLRIVIAKCEDDWKVVTCIDLGNEFACDCN